MVADALKKQLVTGGATDARVYVYVALSQAHLFEFLENTALTFLDCIIPVAIGVRSRVGLGYRDRGHCGVVGLGQNSPWGMGCKCNSNLW